MWNAPVEMEMLLGHLQRPDSISVTKSDLLLPFGLGRMHKIDFLTRMDRLRLRVAQRPAAFKVCKHFFIDK
jgi:hypothetical protein